MDPFSARPMHLTFSYAPLVYVTARVTLALPTQPSHLTLFAHVVLFFLKSAAVPTPPPAPRRERACDSIN